MEHHKFTESTYADELDQAALGVLLESVAPGVSFTLGPVPHEAGVAVVAADGHEDAARLGAVRPGRTSGEGARHHAARVRRVLQALQLNARVVFVVPVCVWLVLLGCGP